MSVVPLSDRQSDALPFTPAHDLRAEEAVLGAIVLSGSAVLPAVVAKGLRAADFYRDRHRWIFEAMLAVHEAGAAIDPVTIVGVLRRTDHLDEVGGPAAIEALAAAVPDAGNAKHYAEIVVDLSTARRRQRAANVVEYHPTDPVALDELRDALDGPEHDAGRFIDARAYLEVDRPPARQLVSSGKSVLLAPGSFLLIAGPAGKGKSLAALDLVGLLASDDGGEWLGATVAGGQRVVLLVLEGSDQDTVERVRQLIPEGALDRLLILDRWRGGVDDALVHRTARAIRRHEADVVLVDTLTAFFDDRYDTRYGVPEQAFADLERLRRASGRDVAIIGPAHTRKADRQSKAVDEVEEIGGTIAKKADAAVTIRGDGDDTPRRHIRFPKVRTGPSLPGKIATFPADPNEPPRLSLVGDLGGRPVTAGTEAEEIAAWIGEHPTPVAAAVLTARFDISDATLRQRRRPQLEELGVTRGKVPGTGNTQQYGTAEQWRRVAEEALGIQPVANPSPDPSSTRRPNPSRDGSEVPTGPNPSVHRESSTRRPVVPSEPGDGTEKPMNTGDFNPSEPSPPTGVDGRDGSTPQAEAPEAEADAA